MIPNPLLPPDWTRSPDLQAAFDQRPCLLRRAWPESHSAAVWSIDALDRCLSQGGLGWPEVRLFKDGSEVPAPRYTVDGAGRRATDLDALLAEYAAGATLQTIGIDVFHPPVRALCDAVIEAFAPHVERIHANAYLTPSDARGFDHHWDTHDVIVLQLEGRKHWQVHGAPLPFPAPEQVCGPHQALIDAAVREGEPLIDTVLEPGDILYLPRGQIHAARTAGACSLHLTLGLHLNTRLGRLRQCWQTALADFAHGAQARHCFTAHGGLADEVLRESLEQVLAGLLREAANPSAVPGVPSLNLLEETLR